MGAVLSCFKSGQANPPVVQPPFRGIELQPRGILKQENNVKLAKATAYLAKSPMKPPMATGIRGPCDTCNAKRAAKAFAIQAKQRKKEELDGNQNNPKRDEFANLVKHTAYVASEPARESLSTQTHLIESKGTDLNPALDPIGSSAFTDIAETPLVEIDKGAGSTEPLVTFDSFEDNQAAGPSTKCDEKAQKFRKKRTADQRGEFQIALLSTDWNVAFDERSSKHTHKKSY